MDALEQFFVQIGFKVDESSLQQLKDILNGIAQQAKEIVVQVKVDDSSVKGAGNSIKDYIGKAKEALSNIIPSGAMDKVRSFVSSAGDTLKNLWSNVSFSKVSDSIATAFKAAKDKVLQMAGSMGGKVKEAFKSLGTSVQSVFKSAFSGIGGIVKSSLSSVGGLITGAFSSVVGSVKNVGSAIGNALLSGLKNIGNIGAIIKGGVTGALNAVKSVASGIGTTLSRGISIAAKPFTSFVSAAKSAVTKVGQYFKDLSAKLEAFSQKFRQSVGTLAKTAAGIFLGSAGVGAVVNSVATELDALSDASIRAGVSAQELAQFERVANLTDSSIESTRSTLESLNKTIGEAANGVGKGAKAFEAFKLKAKNANGELKTASQLYEELALRSTQMNNAQFTAMAQRLGVDAKSIQSLRMQGEAMKSLGQALNKLGFSLKNQSGQLKSFTEMAADLNSMEAAQYEKTLAMVDEGSRNLVRIVADYQKAKQGLSFDENVAADRGSRFRDELGSVTEILKMLKHAIVTDILEPWSDALASLRKRIADNARTIRRVVEIVFKGLIRAFEAVGRAIGKLFSYIDKLVTWFDKLSPAEKDLFKIASAALAITAVVALWYDKLILIPKAIGFILTAGAPLAAMFAAVAAVITGIMVLLGDYYNYVDGQEHMFDWEAFDGILDGFSQSLSNAIQAAKEFFGVFRDNLDVLGVFDQLKAAVQGVIDAFGKLVSGTGGVLEGLFSFDKDKILAGFSEIGDAISTFFNTTIPNLIKASANTILAAIGAVFKWDQSELESISNSINAWIDKVVGAIGKLVSGTVNFAKDFINNLDVTGVLPDLGSAISNMAKAIEPAVEAVEITISAIWNWDSEEVVKGFDALKPAVEAGVQSLNDVAKATGGVVISFAGSLLGWSPEEVEEVKKEFDGIMDTIAGGATNALNGLLDIIGKVTSAFMEVVSKLEPLLEPIKNVINTIVEGVGKLSGPVTEVLGQLVGLISDLFNALMDGSDGASIFDSIVKSIAFLIDLFADGLGGAINLAAEFLGIISTFIKGIRDLVTGEKSLGEVWDDIVDSIVGAITRLAQKFEDWWNDVDGVAQKIVGIFVWLKDQIVGAWDAIVDKVMAAVNYVVDSIAALVDYARYAGYRIANPINGVSFEDWQVRDRATEEQSKQLDSLDAAIKEQEAHRDSKGAWFGRDTSDQFDQAKLDAAIKAREELQATIKKEYEDRQHSTPLAETPAPVTVESPEVNAETTAPTVEVKPATAPTVIVEAPKPTESPAVQLAPSKPAERPQPVPVEAPKVEKPKTEAPVSKTAPQVDLSEPSNAPVVPATPPATPAAESAPKSIDISNSDLVKFAEAINEVVSELAKQLEEYKQSTQVNKESTESFDESNKQYKESVEAYGTHVKEFSDAESNFGQHVSSIVSVQAEFAASVQEFGGRINEFAAHVKELVTANIRVTVSGLPSAEQLKNFANTRAYIASKSSPVPTSISNSSKNNSTSETHVTNNVEVKQDVSITGVKDAQQAVTRLGDQNRRLADKTANAISAVSQKPKGEQ